MDFTCGLVDKFRDLVLDLTWEQLHYLIYYHQNMEQFNEKLEQLTLKRISIQRQKEEAENNVEQIEEEVQRWLNKVDEIWEKVQMLLEKSRDKTECRIMSCPNPWLRYKLSKRAKAMAHEISEIFANANFNRVAHRVLPPSLVQLPNIVNNEGIDSRVQIKRQIIEALQDPSVKVVGLCGLGGVGKTTIAKDVTKEEEIQKKFDKVIMATVSQEMNIGQIQDQIIDKLGMKLDVRTEEVKAFHLSERLKQEKNMLLILDDLWEELELGKVGIPFVDVDQNSKNKGCKILLTSRHLALLSNRMKCQEIIKVGFLSEDEAWELFNRIVGVSIDSSIESIATEIVQKCGGLPLAIATAAKALKDQNIEGWEDYLARLKHPLKRTITGIKEVDNILRLSYDDLSEERKQIFLLAAMMSHDPLIEDLLMYSVGLDILEHAETMAHAHGVIFDVVRKLKSLNLFLDSFSMHRFTIHDVYRDLALSIASHEFKAVIVRNRRLNEWPDEDKLEHCRGICLQESDIGDLPEKLHGPMLELFLLDSDEVDLAIPDLFFESSKQLKLLALTKVHFSSLTSLRFLEKLKALCLHSCVLEDITEVGRLRKLKVLSLAHSKIERLPIELKNLTSLQFLNLSHCSNLIVIPPKLLSSLKKLEVLYMIGSFDQWNIEESNDEADKNASLNELTNLPISCLDIRIPNVSMLPENLFFDTKLKKYKILIGKRWEWRQVNDKTSKILRLELESSIQLTVVIQKLLLGVEDLYLYGSNGQENVLLSHDGRGFPCLKHLHIESNDNIKSIVLKSTNQEVAFPILESLKLKNLKALENLCEGTNALDFCQVLFPNLEILEFSNLNSMIALTWNDQLPHSSFSNLKTFTVNRCGFVTLVPLHVLKCLNKLEELEVRKCEVLETVFDYENLNDFEEIVPSSMVVPLKKLKLSSLQKLKDVWSNHYCQGNVSFPSLRSVEVSFCKSLTSIFPASIAKDMLRNLEELRIGYCGVDVIVAKDQGLQSVDVTFEFPRLTSLTLYSLQKLRNFYPQGHTLKCTNLQRLYIESCDELEIFEKEVSSSVEMLEDETTPDSKYPLLSHIKVDKLEELKLKGIEAEMIGSGRFPMYHFPDVKLLSLCADKAMMASYKCPQFKIFSPGINHTPCLRSVQLSQDYSGKHHEIWDTELNKTFYQQRFFASRELVLDEDDASMIRHDQFPEECCPKVEILSIKGFVDGWVTFPYTLLERFLKLNELLVENGSFEEIFPSYALSSTSFHNLTVLKVSKCHQLVYLMGYSIAESLVNLETLDIDDCKKMREIVRKNTNEDVGEIVFHGLRILKLTHLPTLKTTEDRATNTGCTNISKSLFNHNKVLLPKLENLELSDLLNNLISLIWDDQLLHKSFSNLKTLNVKRCGFMRFVPLHVLNSLNNLEKLEVKYCDKLEMVFGYYKEMESSSAVMPLNLTHLEVEFCRGLTTLMTSSAAQGLVHLTHLSVRGCKQIEEIITKGEGGDDEDEEILFTEMQFLKLDYLPRLKRFSGHGCTLKFPLLDQLIMTRCPKFKIFSLGLVDTPFLKSIQLSKGGGEYHEILDTNLNETIYQQRFVKSKELVLDEDDAVMLRNDKFPEDCCPQVEILEIEGFVDEWVTFPYALLERFPQLNELHVQDSSFGEIFPSHAHFYDNSQLPRIQNLKILHVKNCCNLIKLAPSFASFYNLTELKVSKCHQIVYLMTNLTTKSLVNLDTLEIKDCEKMEEIVCKEVNEDVEGEITFRELRILKLKNLPTLKAQEDKWDFNIEDKAKNNRRNISRSLFSPNKVLLPKLEILELSNLSNNLISLIWDDQLLHKLFSNLKTLIMKRCNSMKFIPLRVLKSLNKLEKLEVSFCGKLEKVFGYEELNDYYKEMESSSLVVPLNIKHLEVKWCNGLTTLMTSSAARSLVLLTHLSVSDCNQIEEIITKEEGGDDEDKEILFTEMEFLKLDNLPRVKRFCGYSYTFKFPLLEHVTITGCPHLTMFCLGDIHALRLHGIRPNIYSQNDIWKTNLNNTIQHLFTFQEVISIINTMVLNAKNVTTVMDVFPKVRKLYVESFKDEGVTFPYRSLERFPKMKWLYVEHSSFKEIFPSQDETITFKGKISPLKTLHIAYLDMLKSIWKDDFQLPPIHQDLRGLDVKGCCNLTKLAPSSASFKNLRWLSISGCHQLIYLVTISTAKSLESLGRLEIHDCKKMEEIVMNETNEDIESGITFNQLRTIKLTDMPSLKMFSSQTHSFEFPELQEIKIRGCPKMKMLCPRVLKTPKLSKVKIEEDDIKWEDEGDLNKIIQRPSSIKDSVKV